MKRRDVARHVMMGNLPIFSLGKEGGEVSSHNGKSNRPSDFQSSLVFPAINSRRQFEKRGGRGEGTSFSLTKKGRCFDATV